MSGIFRWGAKIWQALQLRLNWRQKIRSKMMGVAFLISVLPLTAFIFLTLRMGTSYVFLDATHENQEKASQIAELIEGHYNRKFKALRQNLVSHSALLVQGSHRQQEQYISSLLKESPDLLGVTLGSASGKGNFSKFRITPFQPIRMQIRPQTSHSALDMEIGEVQYFPELQQAAVPLSLPLPALPDNSSEQILTVYFSLQALEPLLEHFPLGAGSELFLENSQGDMILRWGSPAISQANKRLIFSASPVASRLNRVLDNSTFSVVPYLNDRGIKVFGAYARCPTLAWNIFLERNAEIPFRRATQLKIIIFIFAALTVLFSLSCGIWFISRLVRPIEDLEAGIKLVSSGLMGDELPIRSQDEIGRLTQTFNQMTRTLVLRTEEIRAKTRELTFFNTITRIINQSVDLNMVLDDSLQKILQLIHATAGMIYVYHPFYKQMRLTSHFGLSEQFPDAQNHPDFIQGPITKVYTSGEPQMIRDIHRQSEGLNSLHQENIRDLLLVPLRSKKLTLGVLAVGSRRRHTFHYRDLDLLARIGDEIGVAVENALLYAELQMKIKELEEANRGLQEMDRFKNQFLSNVSHELRTPITSIRTYVELFLCDKIGHLDEMQKEKLIIVRRNINNLLSLINDLLTLSRMEDQKNLVNQMEIIVLQEIVDQVIADTVEIASGKGLQLSRTGLTEPVMVRASRQHLQQVLQNLISNAIKFTEKGDITIVLDHYEKTKSPSNDEPDGDSNTERVMISVVDTGIGIPQEELGKVFQRFYQVDSSSTRKYVGTGLGLAIVKEILTSHHTGIHVESKVGSGSRFWFSLPVINPSTSGS